MNEFAVSCLRVEALIPDGMTWEQAIASLPDWRRRKCESLRFEKDRRRSVAAFLALQRLLAAREIDVSSLAVTENEYGKPVFEPSIGLYFSLSHAAERVMAVIAVRPVGCDVERIRPLRDGLARVALAEDEYAALGSVPEGAERDRAFFRLWVRKEAYLKALGCGFSREPRTVSVLSDPPGWELHDLSYPDGYLAATCVSTGCALTSPSD